MPYPLDGEESESSEPTTRIRSSDMAQEVAETARDSSQAAAHRYPSMEDALRYITRPITPYQRNIDASLMEQANATSNAYFTRVDRSALSATEVAMQADARRMRGLISTPARPEALMHRTDRMVAGGERRGPNSILYSRPFRELLRAALEKVHEHLDLWGESDIDISKEDALEELAERRADAAIHKELMGSMKLELEKAQAQLSQAVVVMNNLTIDAVLREVTLTEPQRQQIMEMKYEQ